MENINNDEDLQCQLQKEIILEVINQCGYTTESYATNSAVLIFWMTSFLNEWHLLDFIIESFPEGDRHSFIGHINLSYHCIMSAMEKENLIPFDKKDEP